MACPMTPSVRLSRVSPNLLFLCVSVSLWSNFSCFYQRRKTVEEVVAVLRAGRGLRVILDREHGLAGDGEAFVAAVEQRDMGHDDFGRQAFGQDGEAVILAGDLDLAGGQILDRVIGAAMAEMHFFGLGAQRQGQKLMAEADAEERNLGRQELLDLRHGIDPRCRRIAGAVGEEDAVGLVAENLFGGRRRWNNGDTRADPGEAAQDVALGAVVDGDDVEVRLRLPAITLAELPGRLIPSVALPAAHLDREIHAVETGPGRGL